MNYNVTTYFDWSEAKERQNRRKHGVSFNLAASIFGDPFHLSILDDGYAEEERWITIGQAAKSGLLVVVHTPAAIMAELWVIRIISARRATKQERRDYEEGI